MVAGEDLGFRGGIWAWLGLGLSWGGFEAFVEDLGFRGAFVNLVLQGQLSCPVPKTLNVVFHALRLRKRGP